jgi:hypothetical protein
MLASYVFYGASGLGLLASPAFASAMNYVGARDATLANGV